MDLEVIDQKLKQKRIRKLLDSNKLTDFIAYANYVLKLFGLNNVQLAMDRTNWGHGKNCTNFLIISSIQENIALPLYWIPLDNNGGNSDSATRIVLIKWFVDNFGRFKEYQCRWTIEV